MKKMVYATALLAMVVVVTVGLVGIPGAKAQSGTRVYTQRSSPPQTPFEEKFWNWLRDSNYKNWAPWPGQNGDFYPGESPHGAFLKMYLDRKAISDPENLSYGSVIIKENYGPDKKTLMAITVMYRTKDYDPEHGDWYWVKYDPKGNVAKMGNDRLAGKVEGCIECHSSAEGNDFVFANDG